MNIAIISLWAISSESIGGTERFTIDLATQLSSNGNFVQVFMISGESQVIQGVQYTSLDLVGKGAEANEYDLRNYADGLGNDEFYTAYKNDLSKDNIL